MAAETFETKLAFVSGQDREARRQARAHIMREYQRKKRWKATQQKEQQDAAAKPKGPHAWRKVSPECRGPSPSSTSSSSSSSSTELQDGGSTSRQTSFSVALSSSSLVLQEDLDILADLETVSALTSSQQALQKSLWHPTRHQSGPTSILDSGEPDPFATYPVELDPELRGELFTPISLDLLGYQMFGADKNSKFNPMRDVIFSLSLHDAACYSGLLAMAASHKDFLYERNARADAAKHRISTIQLVNKRLSDPVKSVSDGTIMAITTLWCLEVHYGNPETLQFHVNGLQQLIANRGGLISLATSPRLQMILTWCLLILPGTMSLASSALGGPHPAISPSDPTSTALSLELCTEELTTFIACIHSLSSSSTSVKTTSPYPSESFMFRPGTALHTLLSEPLALRAGHYGDHHIQLLCRLASLLFLHAIYISYSTHSILLQHHLKKVRLALVEHNLDRDRGGEPPSIELLLWVLFKAEGDVTAVGNVERTGHVSRMMSAAKKMRVQTLEGLCELLFGYLQGREGSSWEGEGRLRREVLGEG